MPYSGTVVTLKACEILISGNFIFNNTEGIILANSEEISITNNSLYNCEEYGLSILHPSSSNIVSWNDFIANNLPGTSQAFDNGSSNEFLKNYWYEWLTPDSDNDSIVDKPYPIAGNSDNTDSSPLIHPTNPNSPKDVTAPKSDSSPSWSLLLAMIGICMLYSQRRNS
jgi:parallel beta-helix repeat protein